MLNGVVCFKDGHTERMIICETHANRCTGITDIDFFTISGDYRYRSYVDEVEHGFKLVKQVFEKYDNTDDKYIPADINYIQIGKEAK